MLEKTVMSCTTGDSLPYKPVAELALYFSLFKIQLRLDLVGFKEQFRLK